VSAAPLSEAQQGLLRELPSRVPVERIERVWLFAPREIGAKESGLVVLSLLPDADRPEGQRQVVTWRYEAERVRGRVRREDAVGEEGWAPAEWIPRLIDGVLARLGDESENPIEEAIDGSGERWNALLAGLGIAPVDSAGGE
jgi:hypothetical protein